MKDNFYNQPIGIQTALYQEPQVDIVYNAARKIKINRLVLDSGRELSIIPFTTNAGLICNVLYNDWTIDLDTTGISESSSLGGLMDGLALAASHEYHLYAFANERYEGKGFGVFQRPISTATAASATKGGEGTFTVINKAYRFTLGARVRVEDAGTNWNIGTISSIDSATQIKIVMDNQTWGYAIPNGACTITQLNRFRPYLPDDSTQPVWYPNYRLLCSVYTDGSSDLYNDIFELTKYLNGKSCIPPRSIVAWHGSFVTPPPLPEDWQLCNGLECRIDNSPLIGQVIPNYNGDGRFIRGSATSGTLQNASEIDRYVRNATALVVNTYNTETGTSAPAATPRTTGTAGADLGPLIVAFRPINVSMNWIMKVQ